MKKISIIILFLLFFQIPAQSAHLHLEKEYQMQWCKSHNGNIEYKLPDSTRIDCLTSDYAIEFDFAPKWAESVGQSLYYALCSNRKPGIVLIMEDYSRDLKYLKRLQTVAKVYGITLWCMTSDELSETLNF